jgi:hypothetical protein
MSADEAGKLNTETVRGKARSIRIEPSAVVDEM